MENKFVCDTVMPYSSWLSSLSRNIRANLDTVIPDRVKGTEEEVLLNPCPVLFGISKS